MNLKPQVTRKQSTPHFHKNENFLPPDTHTYVCVSGVNVRFLQNLVCFVFLLRPFRDLTFCLIPDELILIDKGDVRKKQCLSSEKLKILSICRSRACSIKWVNFIISNHWCCKLKTFFINWEHYGDKEIGNREFNFFFYKKYIVSNTNIR